MLGIIYLLFLLKEARNRNKAAIWESQDLYPGAAGSWSQESFGCSGAVVGINPVKKIGIGKERGGTWSQEEKKTQRNKGLSGQIGLGAHLPGIWLIILTKCCPERPKRGEMYFTSSIRRNVFH